MSVDQAAAYEEEVLRGLLELHQRGALSKTTSVGLDVLDIDTSVLTGCLMDGDIAYVRSGSHETYYLTPAGLQRVTARFDLDEVP